MILLVLFLLLAAPAATDIAQRLARWKTVEMPYHSETLNAREKQVVEKLVEASRQIEAIYWQQSDPDGLALYKTTKDANLKRLLMINGGRFDLIDENKPFVGAKPIPPGRNLYPAGLTSAQIEAYVKAHPDEKDAIYSPYTVLRWNGAKLDAIPYHVEYKKYLEPAARSLREAADLSDDNNFAKFLRLRADALLSDDYYPSDLQWMDLKNPKIDVIFAPYETYLDDVLGVKTSYGAALLVRNEPESAKLELYQKYVPDIQDALPLPAADRPSKRGQPTPMEVMDAPFRTGDLLHGYQAVADNLPNDPRIHDSKGTKKIFFKNFMDARVNYVVLPLAKYLMPEAQAARASAEGYLAAGGAARDLARVGTSLLAREREASADHGSHRAGVFGARRSQGRRGGDVRPGVADGSRSAAEESRRGILFFVRGRDLPHGALWRGRGARPRRDDGVQLPGGTEGRESHGGQVRRGFCADAGGDRVVIEGAAHD